MQEEKRRKGPAGRKSTRARGARHEELAAAFLEKQGYVILEKNFFCRTGEIDIIAREGDTLVFVEGKYRKDLAAGDPAEAVNERKQEKIRKAAAFYLYARGLSPEQPCRFDVVAILGSDFRLLRDAF